MSEGVPDPRVLSAAQVMQFNELGYPLVVFEAQEVAALRSHVNAQLAYRHSTEAENNVLTQTTLEAEEQGDPPVTIALRAGQMSLHTPRRDTWWTRSKLRGQIGIDRGGTDSGRQSRR